MRRGVGSDCDRDRRTGRGEVVKQPSIIALISCTAQPHGKDSRRLSHSRSDS